MHLQSVFLCRSLQIKIIELPSKTLVSTLVPDAKLGMVMCIKLFQVSTTQFPRCSPCSPHFLVLHFLSLHVCLLLIYHDNNRNRQN